MTNPHGRPLDNLVSDVRHAVRRLIHTPTLTLVATMTLGLGIGANTAIYSVGSALLRRPFPFPDIEHLFVLWEHHPEQGRQPNARGAGGDRNPMSTGDFIDLRRDGDVFEHLVAYRYGPFNLAGAGDPERIDGAFVSVGFFEALKAQPALGRTFLTEEEGPGRDAAVILSHALWQRRFAGAPDVLGRTVPIDGRPCTIVGVMSAEFDFPLGGVGLWTPLSFTDADRAQRSALILGTLARLRPGVSPQHAQARIDALMGGLGQRYPATNGGRGVSLAPIRELQTGFTTPFVFVFQCAAAFVLAIACANHATLLMARSHGQHREMALRSALGASRWRMVRQLLTEGMTLSLPGAAFALCVAGIALPLIRTSLPDDIVKWVAGWRSIDLDPSALAFTLFLTVGTSTLVGLIPALRLSRPDLNDALKEGGRGSSAGLGRRRLRNLLVVAQLGLALVLLVGAGLMVRGFVELTHHYRGIDPGQIVTLRTSLPEWRYRESRQLTEFYERALAAVQGVPGVVTAGLVSHLPADLGPLPSGRFSVGGRSEAPGGELSVADIQTVSPGYFRVLRMSLVLGRSFDGHDNQDGLPVAIVSQSLAGRVLPGEDPIGKRIKLGRADDASVPWRRVVGVVADVKQYWFDRQPRSTVYLVYSQAPRREEVFVARVTSDPGSVVAGIRARLRDLDPRLPLDEVRTFDTVVKEATALIRVAAGLVLTLGLVALVLAAGGVHGLMAYVVSQRTHEIGVRMALGASGRDVSSLVLGESVKLAALGVAVGLPLVFVLGRWLASAMFGVVPPDLPTMAIVALGLMGVAVVAGWAPARRASTVDPVVVLRGE